jgi:uncharacterized short protein YbdD (DUF466 family)
MTAFYKNFRCAIKTIFGLPNYEKYVDHHQRKHPNEPMMSEKEYYLYTLKQKYENGKTNRCC